MWGLQSPKTRPILAKPPCNASPKTKDCRVVKLENWVTKLNICTELGLCVRLSHPKTVSELTKPPCIKKSRNKNKIKTKSFSHIKEHIWFFVIKVISFNFKDDFIIARKPLVCGIIFYNCPIVPIVQTAWMVNSGYQREVVEKGNFVAVSDSDLKRVFRKALEKLVIFANLIMFNMKMLEMDHQDECRLNKWSIFDAFLISATQTKEISPKNWHNVQFFFPNSRTEATVVCNNSTQCVRE